VIQLQGCRLALRGNVMARDNAVPRDVRIYLADNRFAEELSAISSFPYNPITKEPPAWLETVPPLASPQVLARGLADAGDRPRDRDDAD